MSAGVTKAKGGKILRPFVVDRHVDRRRIVEERTNRLDDEVQHHAREKDEGDRPEHPIVNTFASSDAWQCVSRRVQTELTNDRPTTPMMWILVRRTSDTHLSSQ